MKTPLNKLKAQRDTLNARIQAAEARERTVARKQDLRRKILVGAYYLDKAEKEGGLLALYQQLDDFLTRDTDRALFDLPPRSVATPGNTDD